MRNCSILVRFFGQSYQKSISLCPRFCKITKVITHGWYDLESKKSTWNQLSWQFCRLICSILTTFHKMMCMLFDVWKIRPTQYFKVVIWPWKPMTLKLYIVWNTSIARFKMEKHTFRSRVVFVGLTGHDNILCDR